MIDTPQLTEAIAVIGLAGRFPGARNLHQFWQNLRNGVESISRFTDQELEARGVPKSVLSDSKLVKAGTMLDDAELFDAGFFGYNPREAEIIDPQHRLFLEGAWEALECAGYNPETWPGSIGVYAGVSMNTYVFNLYSNREAVAAVGGYQLMLGNDKDYLTTRVSYKLNLKGPSFAVQTACSTSLVAVQLACQSLLNYQCDMALAGGVSLTVPQGRGYFYQEGMILSPDGHCRAFDAKAQGIVSGQGFGIVVLKRLSEALKDRDTVRAVIKGAAINNDGALKVGYTAPSIDGQAEVVAAALAFENIHPETINYIEAHGTGTPLGDPIEIAALTHAFRARTQKRGFCAIGSVKTNIGHLDAAAGVAGLIKTILALEHNEIPPSLHFEQPNPKIDFDNSPFYVNSKLTEWKTGGAPRRAGVSSFGIGGTNAHVVLEEAPVLSPPGKSRPCQLLLFSAKTSSALTKFTQNFSEYLRDNPDLNLPDAAYTLQVGRKAFGQRRMLVCRDRTEAIHSLETLERVFTSTEAARKRSLVFLFPGQGAQYPKMAWELYLEEPTFREQVDCCSELLQPLVGADLRQVLYPSEAGKATSEQLDQTALTQPALFLIEYALAKLWMSWGLIPGAMIGHSIGEYVAASLAGVFSLPEALALVAARGRLMQELPPGGMLALPLAAKEVEALLRLEEWKGRLALAAINSPTSCVVSGASGAIQQMEAELTGKGLACRRLHTSHAFHSPMMDPILRPFTERVSQMKLNPPTLPFISNLTGTWITKAQATDPGYWARHLRNTVRFSDGVVELLKENDPVFLEVGPGQTLSTLTRQHLTSGGPVVLSSLRHPHETQSDLAFALGTLGRLWLTGIEIDWAGFYVQEARHRIPLPSYAFDRQRYWIEPQKREQTKAARQEEGKIGITDWFYQPTWKRSLAAKPIVSERMDAQPVCWLIFMDDCGLGTMLARKLEQQGHQVIAVHIGKEYAEAQDGNFTISPGSREDYDALFEKLRDSDKIPEKIVHLWGVTHTAPSVPDIGSFSQMQDRCFYSLLFIAQALARQHITQHVVLDVLTNHLHEIAEDAGLMPEKATVLGGCKVIPQEYANITCRSIDVALGESNGISIEKICAELNAEPTDFLIAYRGKHRWVQGFEPVKLELLPGAVTRLRKDGVYLITGGLGAMGLTLADCVARSANAKLILVARSGLPSKEQWTDWLAAHPESDAESRKIRQVQALEALGSEIMILRADVAHESQFRTALSTAEERFGPVHGVIHAAGFLTGATIQEMSRDHCEKHFHPKVYGLMVLAKIFAGRELDFCLLTSSLSAVLGGLGFAGYAAANSFMDSFAHRQNQTGSIPWITVNWDAWQFGEDLGQNIGPLAGTAIRPAEGAEAFLRILSLDSGSQVAVSTFDLQRRIDKWIKLESFRETEQARKSKPAALHPRPALSSVYVAPGNSTEEAIVEIWQQLLGIEKVGINDNFFELGGHSLLATQVIARLRGAFPVEFTVASLFERPTVHSLSQLVLAEAEDAPSFVESSSRGKKRKERKLERMNIRRGDPLS